MSIGELGRPFLELYDATCDELAHDSESRGAVEYSERLTAFWWDLFEEYDPEATPETEGKEFLTEETLRRRAKDTIRWIEEYERLGDRFRFDLEAYYRSLPCARGV